MLKKQFMIFLSCGVVFSSTLFGLTLKQSAKEVLNNNPIVKERLRNYRATQQDLNIAESEYYPKLDFRAAAGYNSAGNLNNKVIDMDYTNYETSLTLTQNIFNGFGTMHKVDYQEARILAAAYHYIEKSNDIAFRMVSSYINVLRSLKLLNVAKENVNIVEDIHAKVKDLYNAGLTAESEVKKIQSALSLARSNLIVQQNNTRDKEYNFRRILGRMPDTVHMQKPRIGIAMPKSIENAAEYAMKHNPSLLVSRYNIKGAQALMKQKKKNYYPKIDLEISQFYNEPQKTNAFDQSDDRFRARIVFSYNFFNGGADKADIQKSRSKINQEVEIKRDLRRQVIEGMDLSWDAYKMVGKQLKDLKDYLKFSTQTLKLYEQEYSLGRRTLLDLLSAQNDLINSRKQIITAQYELIFSKYRILDAMGIMVSTILGDNSKLTSAVNLYTNTKAHETLDTLPIKLDVDYDDITDNSDICNSSLKENNIMTYGCKKKGAFEEIIRFNAILFKNDKLKDANTSYLDKIISTIKKHIKNHEDVSISIIGHTDEPTDNANEKTINSDTYASKIENELRYHLSTGRSFELGRKYATDIKNRLEKSGIDKKLLVLGNEGGFDKAYTDSVVPGRELSNRVMVTLYVKNPRDVDSDGDSVKDSKDKCPNTPKGVKVDSIGCPLDSDKDGVANYLDICPNTPKGFKVNNKGCPIVKNLHLNFKSDSYQLSQDSLAKVTEFANFLKLYPKYKVQIFGYTDSIGKADTNMVLSKKRVNSVKKALVEKGINASRLEAIGMGEKNPIGDNFVRAGRKLNRRIEAKLLY